MTTTLTQQNAPLLDALAAAKKRIGEERAKQASIARDVRSILFDIAADALMPLPVSLQTVMPDNNLGIVGDAALQNINDELTRLEVALR